MFRRGNPFDRAREETSSDKISTGLVECEHVKAKILKALRADGSPCVWKKFSSRARTKGFPLLNISVGLLFAPQSGIGVHTERGN